MPGLVGIVQKHSRVPLDRGLFQRMVMTLRHHSWYQTDTYLVPKAAIARLHLNIINPAPQPFVSDTGRLKVFLHGEIYNDEADEANQLDYVAQAYERFGLDFAAQLNGSFVVLLIDNVADMLVLATDRTASKPVFYYQDESCLYFAPEPKALMLVPSLPKRINLSAVASFLACGHYLNGQALLEDIHPLDNATVLIANSAGVSTRKYWHYTFDEGVKDRGAAYYQDALRELIRQAVRRRIRSKHRYGVLLSGGYDSRGILGCYLAERPHEPVTTISWGVTQDIPQSDCAVAKRLALHLGLPHVFYPVRMTRLAQHLRDFVYIHDGLTDACSNYPESLKNFSAIRGELGLHVILRGDESFGFSHPACNERTVFEKLSILSLDKSYYYKKLLKSQWLSNFSELMEQTIKDISLRSNTRDVYLYQNFVYLDQRIKHCINPLNYLKTNEVEVRTPYLDNDILNFMRELPGIYHFGKKFYRTLILKMFPNLFYEMATQSNLPNLDRELKATNMRDFIYQTSLVEESLLLQYFEFDALRGSLDNYFLTENYESSRGTLVSSISKFLRRWPHIYNTAYKVYLPLQDRQQHSIISFPTIILRIMTLNLYHDSLLKVV